MSEIRIGPAKQMILGAALVAGVGAAVAAQMPELRRYLKVRKM
jgi:hypothetical protein